MHHTQSRLYLGVDPSLTSTGVAFVGVDTCEVHVIKPGKLRGGDRLKYHVDLFRELVKGVGPIQAACIEGPSLKSENNADFMGQIRGVYLYALADFGIKTFDPIPPTSLKLFATGNGLASKERMLEAADRCWPQTTFTTDDAADAAWLASLAQALSEDVPVTPSKLSAIRGIRNSKTKPCLRLNRHNNI